MAINMMKIPTGKQGLNLRVAQGHFATSHSHMNYFIDITMQKTRLSEAQAVAKELGLELVIMNMDFDAVCLSVGQQKCDIAMAGLTVKPEREEYVTFTTTYYSASQKIIAMEDDTTFDACTDAASVEAILNGMDASTKIGVQNGTTGKFYVEGDAEWGFNGFKVTCTGYANGTQAVQDMINGGLNYVIIDSAPAACIAEAFNKLG